MRFQAEIADVPQEQLPETNVLTVRAEAMLPATTNHMETCDDIPDEDVSGWRAVEADLGSMSI